MTVQTAAQPRWSHICALHDILPDSGVAALINGQQVAVFRVRDAVHAIGNYDPASGANVLSRGLVGDVGGEVVVASPIYKQHFSLVSGRCLEEPSHTVPVYLTRIVGSEVWVRGEAVTLRRRADRPRLVVIGNGAAAQLTLEELLELAPETCEITVFDAEHEPRGKPREWYRERGVALRSGDPIVQLDRVRRTVKSARGVQAPYDRLLIATGATGLEPNIELAQAASLRCDRGILVDDTLLTYDPAIYAVGECVEHRHQTFAHLAPLSEQARVCAAHLAERGVRRLVMRASPAASSFIGVAAMA